VQAVSALLPATVDRAAVLREAADSAYRIARRLDDQQHDERAQGAWDVENALRAELRRMADETQQPTGACPDCGHLSCDGNGPCGAITKVNVDTEGRCACTRRVVDEAQQPETQPTGWRLTPQTLDVFVRALVNEVDYDIHKGYECGEDDGEDHYPELVAEAAEMLDAITKPRPFIPPAHYRRDDGVDCCVHAAPVGPDSCRHCRELHDDESPAAGAQQPKEA